ncbi:MAG: histidine kinase [Herbinix sp.]|jgi:signal transduction histidine kinase|nr:histidine kinase [Herbinix sp.]
MNLIAFISEKISLLILHLFCVIGLVLFLKIMGLPNSAVVLILLCWTFLLGAYLTIEYHQIKRKHNAMYQAIAELDQKYLIFEVLQKPSSQLEKVYYSLLRDAAKSMTEEVGKAREAQSSYKEYIEKWIHEIKSPITAIQLICDNHKTEETKRISQELHRIYYLVEQTLYYARSETVEQDYFIKQVSLYDIVQSVLLSQRTTLMDHHISLQIEEIQDKVWTDEKWLHYIISQIITNAIKYRREENSRIHIDSKTTDQGVLLSIEDNGIGILASDLPRIFEKGFTGTNRSNIQSTGLGLYLCKKLCDKLGLIIYAMSEKDQYTRITLFFPIGKLTAEVSQVLTKL